MSPDSLLAEKLAAYRSTFDAACRGLVAEQIRGGVHSIAEDFAREFNSKLASAARNDPTVDLVASNYEMGADHVGELEALLARPLSPLLAKIDAGDHDAARRAAADAWPLVERIIRSKWQAYFVLTFQDVSVERKAARDRKKLQRRFVEQPMSASAPIDTVERPRGVSPWIAVVALLLLAAAGGWILMHHHHVH